MVLEDTPDGERNEISEYIRTRNELIPESYGRPASTMVGCSHLLCKPCIVEVDFIALTKESRWQKELVDSPSLPKLPRRQPARRQSGALCLLLRPIRRRPAQRRGPGRPEKPGAVAGKRHGTSDALHPRPSEPGPGGCRVLPGFEREGASVPHARRHEADLEDGRRLEGVFPEESACPDRHAHRGPSRGGVSHRGQSGRGEPRRRHPAPDDPGEGGPQMAPS